MILDNFFLVFVLAHLTGDFVFQTDAIAAKKASGVNGLLIHSFIVLLIQVMYLSLFGIKGISLGALCGIVHFCIDYLKNWLQGYFKNLQLLYFIIDQLLHILMILLLTQLFPTGHVGIDKQYLLLVKFFISFIIASYVSSISVKLLLKDLYASMREDVLFKKNERIFDALSGIALWGMMFLPVMYGAASGLVQFYFYQMYQKKCYGYKFSMILAKYSILMMFSFLAYAFMRWSF